MKTVAFIGIGVMGNSMASNLMKKGFSIRAYTRTKEKANAIVEQGAVWCDSVKECVQGAEAVITIVGYPKDVEEVYFGENGIIANAAPGTYLIDMTTTSPKLSVRIYNEAKERGLFSLDAPVSGGDVGAKNATLSIMVGGDADAFNACMPLFEAMGKSIIHAGKEGCGQHTKMANQIAIAGAVSGVCEAMCYARANGLDVDNMLSCISGGAAGSWQLSNMAPRILKGDFAPGFFIKHYIKDMHIAQEGAADANVTLSVLDAVCKMYEELDKQGFGDDGTQALIKYYPF